MSTTKIEWATHTMNDQTGCRKISPACDFCYALPLSVRLSNMGQDRYDGATNQNLSKPQWTGDIHTVLEVRRRNFATIRRASKTRRTFYGSMSDLWHESLDVDGPELSVLAEEVAALDEGCKTTQVVMFLTKRPKRLLRWQEIFFPTGLPPQVWVGTTVETQQFADIRVPILCNVKSAVRYLSCEPLLSLLTLQDSWKENLHWVIGGGESGHKARPSNPVWIKSLRDQSVEANIPFHFKQWGEWGEDGVRVGKKRAGRMLEGRTWDGLPISFTQSTDIQ